MALPEELQNQVDYHTQIENNRAAHLAAADAKRSKLEALRMAKDIIMENNRVAPAGSMVSASDVTTLAASLEAFVNS